MKRPLKRESDAFHVLAAKNIADRAAKAGVKRSDALESFAKQAGHPDWNTYVALGKPRLRLKMEGGSLVEISPGLSMTNAETLPDVALAMIMASLREGMSCKQTGPIVLMDEKGFDLYTFAHGKPPCFSGGKCGCAQPIFAEDSASEQDFSHSSP